MGKLSEDIWSGYSGRVGNVVGYNWRGKWCVRIRPAGFHDAKSDKQMEQRSLFRQTVAFAGRLKEALRIGLHRASLERGMTECNYFMKINKGRFSVEEGRLKVDYENLVISEGPVAPVAFLEPELVDECTLRIGFEKNPLHKVTHADDLVYVLLLCPGRDGVVLSTPVCRRDRGLEILLPEEWIGEEIHLWGFVVDNRGRCSMSDYIGSGACEEEEAELQEEDPEYPEGSENSESSEYSEHSEHTGAAGPPGGL